MIVEELKKSILNYAACGKLSNYVESDLNVSDMLAKIKKEKSLLSKSEILIGSKIKPIKEQIFKIPSHWNFVRIGEISKIISKGTTPKGGKNAYKNDGIPFVRAENVDKNVIFNAEIKYIDEKTHLNELKRSILCENDILICIAGTLGRSGVVLKKDLPLNTNQAVAFIRLVNQKLINPWYMYYIISSEVIQKQLIDQKKITAIPNLTLEIITNCVIPIPPIEEQQRIVDKIEELFSKLDEIKPIEDELNNIKIEFPNEMKKSILSNLFKDTSNISKEKLSSIISFSNIKNSECGDYKYLEVKYLRGSMKPKILKKGKFVEKNSLSILVDGENSGEIFKIPENGYLGSTLKSLNISPNILEEYLIYYLMLKKEYFKSNKRGSAIPHLDKNLFFNSMIYLPSKEEQQRIVDKIERLIPLCSNIEKIISNY